MRVLLDTCVLSEIRRPKGHPRVRRAVEAFADLDNIRGYSAHENPDAAERVMSEIYDAIRELVRFPNQGHKRPDVTSRPLRFSLVREYLIAYCARTNAFMGGGTLQSRLLGTIESQGG